MTSEYQKNEALIAVLLGLCSSAVFSQTQATGTGGDELPPVSVSAFRYEQPLFDAAATQDVVTGARIRQTGSGLQLSEVLNGVPGVLALDRQNAAQDTQLSIRGFGSRASFGVRGVRLYEDGVPLSQPDGQGQTGTLDLWGAQRVEVLRGPSSVMYGNASGGVIQVFSAPASPQPEATVGLVLGSDDTWATNLSASGTVGGVGAVFRAQESASGGFRHHSASRRSSQNARFTWESEGSGRLSLTAKHVVVPEAKDPLGLTWEQAKANPRMAGNRAESYDTRKYIEQSQLAAQHEWQRGNHRFQWLVYAGDRSIKQFQAIPAPPESTIQNRPTHPGGVIDLERVFAGADMRWHVDGKLAGRDAGLTLGWAYDELRESRKGYQNFSLQNGQVLTGVEGGLKRNERNKAGNADPYLQARWRLFNDLDLQAGVRHSTVRIKSKDRYVVVGNGDDSGSKKWEATTPVVGLLWQLSPDWNVHASYGKSFETPTLNEVAYRSVSGLSTGLNTDLKASTGDQLELGSRWRWSKSGRLELTAYQIKTEDELAVAVNSFGRSTFQNVGGTTRHGLEMALDSAVLSDFQRGLRARLSLTISRAVYDASFLSTSAGTSTLVTSGNDLPGIPASTAFAELSWRPAPQGWHGALEWRNQGRIWANDLNDAKAPSFSRWALRAGWSHVSAGWRLDGLFRVDNILDKKGIGSVIVNEGNRQFFEPAPGRAATLSVNLSKAL